jgi:hypothetical protein
MQTHQLGKITVAAIGTAIVCGFVLLLMHQAMRLRTKQPAS